MRELIILYTETNTTDDIGGFTTALTQLREQYADCLLYTSDAADE